MFRCGLLATTAFVVVGTLSFLAARSAAVAQSGSLAVGRDRNVEFLCAYGGIAIDEFGSGSSYYSTNSGWTHVAFPIVGRGRTVTRITVREARESLRSHGIFSAGIYSNASGGIPGNPISVGRGKAGVHCGKVTISIYPTTLERNKKYWVEETIPALRHWDRGYVELWATDPRAKHNAYVQYHHYSGLRQSSYTLPWTESTAGVYVRIK